MSDVDASTAEFDVMAGWTADAVAEVGADHAVPAACRGSGSPAALDWLIEELGLERGGRLLDCGAGTGGPAAYVRGRVGVVPVLAEPELDACRAARRMFGQPTITAAGGQLPLRAGSVDAAWALGVLSTTPDRGELLGEARRVLRPGCPLGLLDLVQVSAELPEQPEDNHFFTADDLDRSLHDAGFRIEASRGTDDLPSPPADWDRRADLVEEVVARDHRNDPRWIEAQDNEATIGRLLGGGHLELRLVHARPA